MQAFRGILMLVIFAIAYLQAQDFRQIPIPVPEIELKGFAFDGKNFWGLDSKLQKIHSFDKEGQKVLKTIPVKLEKPNCCVYDGSDLWIAEEEKPKLVAIDVKTGKVKRELTIEIPQERGFKSIEGLTWDGKYFWIAVFAGFSSSFYQVDPESGSVLKSIYAECNPRGIATNGEQLWSICYNGEKLPSKIDVRPIEGKSHEILNARKFVTDIDIKHPSGLVFSDNQLHIGDRDKKAIIVYPIKK